MHTYIHLPILCTYSSNTNFEVPATYNQITSMHALPKDAEYLHNNTKAFTK